MLTMNDIIREGHPTLSQVAKPVPLPLEPSTKATLKAMRQFLIDSQDPEKAAAYALRPGVGLAAPQINVPLRMMAIYTTDEEGEALYDLCLVNPVVLSHSTRQTYMPNGEGCLSIDREVEGLVPRHHKVTFKAHVYDPEADTFEEQTFTYKGYLAIVFQHELDHLNGILFTARIQPYLEGIEPIKFSSADAEEEASS